MWIGPRYIVPVILRITFVFIVSVLPSLRVMSIVVDSDFIFCGFLEPNVISVISFGSPFSDLVS